MKWVADHTRMPLKAVGKLHQDHTSIPKHTSVLLAGSWSTRVATREDGRCCVRQCNLDGSIGWLNVRAVCIMKCAGLVMINYVYKK